MAKWRQRLENIASSTFRSASRCRFVLFCFCSVFVGLPMNPVGECVSICVSASKHLQGKKQSELTVKILGNDGKELKEGQDINVTMHDGKISVNVINPKRGKSGTFKVTLSRL